MSNENIQLKTYKFDINVEEVEYKEAHDVYASLLSVKFSGKDYNLKIVNSLRRASQVNVPTYAIAQELIKIETNTTIAYNNDYMKLRLSNLPVLGIDSELYFLPEKYWNKNTINFSDLKREKYPTERNVEFWINIHNNSANELEVTTRDIKMYIDGEQSTHVYNKIAPMLLINLRPNERFKCHMKAVLATGERSVIWEASRNSYYDYEDADEDEMGEPKFIILTVEGNNQCNEYEILVRSCKYLMKKYTDLKNDLESKIASKQILPEKIIHLKLTNENHTVAEPLNYEFQDHDDIIRSGVSKPDQLVKSMLITVEATPKAKTPIYAMIECIDNLIKKLSHIGKLIDDMNPDKKTKKSKK